MGAPIEPAQGPLIAELTGERPARPPVWLMRQAGRYLPEYRALRQGEPDFLRFCYTPELAIEATLQPLRRYALDAAIIFSDILVIPDALGARVRFVEGEGPVLEAVRTAAELDRLRPDGVAARLDPVYAAIGGVRAALDPATALIGFAGGPWTLACYMIEGGASAACLVARRLAYAADGTLDRLIALLTEAVAAHLLAQIAAGAGVVQLFDSWAGVLAEEPFRRLVIAPTRTIVTRLRAARPEVPIIGFPRGAGVLYRDFVDQTGVDAVSIDAGLPLDWAARVLQPQAAVQGNLDNALLAEGGPALVPAVERILARLASGRLVVNLGHGVLPETPPAHVAAVVDAVHAFRRG